jgi:hypothetical protein
LHCYKCELYTNKHIHTSKIFKKEVKLILRMLKYYLVVQGGKNLQANVKLKRREQPLPKKCRKAMQLWNFSSDHPNKHNNLHVWFFSLATTVTCRNGHLFNNKVWKLWYYRGLVVFTSVWYSRVQWFESHHLLLLFCFHSLTRLVKIRIFEEKLCRRNK